MVIHQTGIEQYPVVFALTMVVVAVKLLLLLYLSVRVWNKYKEEGGLVWDFPTGVFFLMLGLLISRIFFIIFDFIYTALDPTKYIEKPGVYFWQIGLAISGFGLAILVLVVDKKVLNNKFKGILAYIVLAAAIFELIYPINSSEDFQLISLISTVPGLVTIFIPFMFLWLGFKTPGLRKTAWTIAFGVIIYALSALIVNEFLLNSLRDRLGDVQTAQTIIYLLFTSFKSIGLILLTYGSRQFTN